MPNWLRIALLILVAGILALTLAGVLAFRWIRKHSPELAERGKRTIADARKFADGKGSPDCIEEGIRRAGETRSFLGMIESRVFVDECLNVATEPAGFCNAVPTGVLGGAKWVNAKCARRGKAGDQGCAGVYQSVMDHCRRK
jgi:hypothetical protein